MSKIEDKVQMTWKGFKPSSFCGVQYAYGAGNEIFVYMKDSADSLLALCRASKIDVDTTEQAPYCSKIQAQLHLSLRWQWGRLSIS